MAQHTWTWSIQASGLKEDCIASVKAQTLPKMDDGSEMSPETATQFANAQGDALAKLAAMPPGSQCTVGISGNDVETNSAIRRVVAKPAEAQTEVQAIDYDQLAAAMLRLSPNLKVDIVPSAMMEDNTVIADADATPVTTTPPTTKAV